MDLFLHRNKQFHCIRMKALMLTIWLKNNRYFSSIYFKVNSGYERIIQKYLRKEYWEKFWMQFYTGLYEQHTIQLYWTFRAIGCSMESPRHTPYILLLMTWSCTQFHKTELPIGYLVSCRLLVWRMKLLLKYISLFPRTFIFSRSKYCPLFSLPLFCPQNCKSGNGYRFVHISLGHFVEWKVD
jgi:hypothetical protein